VDRRLRGGREGINRLRKEESGNILEVNVEWGKSNSIGEGVGERGGEGIRFGKREGN